MLPPIVIQLRLAATSDVRKTFNRFGLGPDKGRVPGEKA